MTSNRIYNDCKVYFNFTCRIFILIESVSAAAYNLKKKEIKVQCDQNEKRKIILNETAIYLAYL